MKQKISAKIVADSTDGRGNRITSYILTYPRMIHAEVMTHRLFSRNAASSRAIPFKTMVKNVLENPFIPIAWQKDHKGMQGSAYFEDADLQYGIKYKTIHDDSRWSDSHTEWIGDQEDRDITYLIWDGVYDEEIDYNKYSRKPGPNLHDMELVERPMTEAITEQWLEAALSSVSEATAQSKLGVTKQLCNRLLEPYQWYTCLVTATEYDNFFELRCPVYHDDRATRFYSKKDLMEKGLCITTNGDEYDFSGYTELDWIKQSESGAEIHIQALAEAMWDARNDSSPVALEEGEWHIPFGEQMDDDKIGDMVHMNAARGETWGPKEMDEIKLKIASARCARLSYMTFDGEIDYDKDAALHDMLLQAKHMSPFEHCAKAMSGVEYNELYQITHPKDPKDHKDYFTEHHGGWCRNFKGFIPYRHLVDVSATDNE